MASKLPRRSTKDWPNRGCSLISTAPCGSTARIALSETLAPLCLAGLDSTANYTPNWLSGAQTVAQTTSRASNTVTPNNLAWVTIVTQAR
jgi:hypothetical protein